MKPNHSFETLGQDVRFACRLLKQSPIFAATAILSLAIGIGANTAIFSVVDAVMIKQLPVAAPEQLRALSWSADAHAEMPYHSYDGGCSDGPGRQVCSSFSYPAFQALAAVPQFKSLIAFSDLNLNVTAQGRSEMAFGQIVSGNYFAVLGVRPLLGRALQVDDERPSQPLVAVLTYEYWTRRFGGNPSALGAQILINNKPATVVGVAPPAFLGLSPGDPLEIYVPIGKSAVIGADWAALDKPDFWWVQVFARMQPDAMDARARSASQAIFQHQMQAYSGKTQPSALIEVEPGARGLALLKNDLAPRLYILAAAVLLVLLIACVNLANLLLSRATARRREIAIRLSMGASRPRLLQQLLTEGTLLSLAGGALGLLIASPIMRLLLSANRDQPLAINAALDARTLFFAFAISLFTGMLFSLLPALSATRVDLSPALKEGSLAGAGTSPRLRLGRLLVAVQVGLSLLLLIGAGLFVRTLIGLESVPLGFNPENILTFRTDPSLAGMKGPALAEFYARVRQRIERIPGVRSVALSRHALIDGGRSSDSVRIAGEPIKRSYAKDNVFLHFCSDSFLSTFKTPILLGRDLLPADAAGAQPVAVVNEKFARKYFANASPIGREFYLGDTPEEQAKSKPIQIVGLAADAHYTNVRSEPTPTAYLPYLQHADNLAQMVFSIRTAVPPLAIAEPLRKAVAQVDESVPVARIRTEQQLIDRSIGSERLFAGLVSWLGAVAALLAAIGLYGVVNYSVSRRTAEIGIRLAIGANSGDVLRLILSECFALVAAGLLMGIAAAATLTNLLESLLFSVKPTDLVTYLAAASLMVVITLIAALIPARRAARIQPILALKHE